MQRQRGFQFVVVDLAYVHAVRAPGEMILDLIRERFEGTLVVAGDFDQAQADVYLSDGKADLVAFGRKFLANPDLPQRFRQDADLNNDDPSTYYGGGAKGYTDYPSLAQERGDEPCGCIDGTAFNAGGPCDKRERGSPSRNAASHSLE